MRAIFICKNPQTDYAGSFLYFKTVLAFLPAIYPNYFKMPYFFSAYNSYYEDAGLHRFVSADEVPSDDPTTMEHTAIHPTSEKEKYIGG